MLIRPYADLKSELREAAHYAAHADRRDRGILVSNTLRIWIGMQVVRGGIPPFYGDRVPALIPTLLRLQAERASKELLDKFNLKRPALVKLLDKSFQRIKGTDFYTLPRDNLTLADRVTEISNALMQSVEVGPAFSATLVLDQLVKLLKQLGFDAEKELHNMRTKFELSLLALMHGAEYELDKDTVVPTHIGLWQGKLAIKITVKIREQSKELIQGIRMHEVEECETPLMETELDAERWCSPGLVAHLKGHRLPPGQGQTHLPPEIEINANGALDLVRPT
ncbi:hypothetical protein [Bordetella sp. BOR01]|uniref:hypothetical protein n=1 Tax=Bordetella sp. BOR01 TaxID=2854779 RepID=UPI001C468E27|nr:hypothetical protein [Bordetella sp. BOR01]MBV7482538.1 hypothetical protein [Bordetella sp. BOR01]